MNFKEELKKRASIVEQALERYLPPEDAHPPVIHRAMRYSTIGGGKRLRPVLAIASAESVGGSPFDVLPAACALELIHAYSLIHDDLPAMDNDDYRRGKLTSHKVFGEAMAILAGDALLTLAFQLLSENKNARPENVIKV
ncbi:MAG TPA: polyprenyl synthetase family protein, partial [Bacillota bacterium]|nr:polyprenyl synthetase family protein [Bacillota bacterium]